MIISNSYMLTPSQPDISDKRTFFVCLLSNITDGVDVIIFVNVYNSL